MESEKEPSPATDTTEQFSEKLLSGNEAFDSLLDGGYEKGVVTAIYGPAGSGKTTACLMALVQAVKGKKAVFIDTEGGFSVERLKLLTPDFEKVLQRTLVHSTLDFAKQDKDINNLKHIGDKIGLVICDTISSLYRAERGEDNYELNRELARQVAVLVELARKKNIPIIITSQVYADFEDKTRINLVGGDIIRYSAKCLIEMQSLNNKRAAILKKHRYLPERSVVFEIRDRGFFPVKQEKDKEKGFKIF